MNVELKELDHKKRLFITVAISESSSKDKKLLSIATDEAIPEENIYLTYIYPQQTPQQTRSMLTC